MNWISNKVKEAGAKEEVITPSSVNGMFQAVSLFYSEAERDCQKILARRRSCARAVRTRG